MLFKINVETYQLYFDFRQRFVSVIEQHI